MTNLAGSLQGTPNLRVLRGILSSPTGPGGNTLARHAVESFFGGGVAVGQGQGGAKLDGRGGAVALLFQQLSEDVMSFERGALLNGRMQIAAQEPDAEGNAAAGAEDHAGAVHERFGAVERAGLHGNEGLLHLVEVVGVAVEDGKIEPRVGAALAGIDGGAVFAFGERFVFGALG